MIKHSFPITLLITLLIAFVQCRENATGAIETFLITECDDCVWDGDSIFCTEGKDEHYVQNLTDKITISKKKEWFGPADGARYCWEGTFGKMLNHEGHFDTILGSVDVNVSLACSSNKLFYRQCILSNQLSIILVVIGSILFLIFFTCGMFWCGCCKCFNRKGDKSPWGMCNRFCPWMPCSDDVIPEVEEPKHLINPVTEEDNKSSLFGRNPTLQENRFGGAMKTEFELPGSVPSKSSLTQPSASDFQTNNPLKFHSNV